MHESIQVPVQSKVLIPEIVTAGYEIIPESIRTRVVLLDGVLHISSEQRGTWETTSLVRDLKHRGLTQYIWHDPTEFDAHYAKNVCGVFKAENEIQEYAVELLAAAHQEKASDIHIKDKGTYTLIRFRIMGMLKDHTQLEAETGRQLIRTIYQAMCQSADSTFSPKERQDGRIAKRNFLPREVHSVRVHTEPTECVAAEDGTATCMMLRLLHDSTEARGSLEERTGVLGFTKPQQEELRFLTTRTGLSIISGPTGHGKSTLLKHVMESMAADNPEKSFMSIEDPPEYPLKGVDQVLVSTKAVLDLLIRGQMYTNAIAGAMRSDPDTLMIGEIRYPEAAMAAINAAMTGHAVWATIHANNAFGIIARMVSMLNAGNFQESLEHLCDPNVLAGLTYQRLIPVLCPHCKISLTELMASPVKLDQTSRLPERLFERLSRVFEDLSELPVHVRGDGCEHCNHLGLVGQTVAAEVIATDQEMLRLLRNPGGTQDAYQYWIKEKEGLGYVSHASQLIAQGVADPYLTELRLGVPLDFNKSFLRKGARL